MDRPIRRLLLFFTLLFVALIVQLTYVQVYAAPKYRVHPANTAAVEEEMKMERGAIISADGVELAINRKADRYFLLDILRGALVSPWPGLQQPGHGGP